MAIPMQPTITDAGGSQSSPAPKMPDAITQSAVQAPQPPTPAYSGPSINSIPHVADRLGATYKQDPTTGNVSVNGTSIQPIRMVNGIPHAPVVHVAQAAGYPANHIQPAKNGTVNVMPTIHIGPANQPTILSGSGQSMPAPAAQPAPQQSTPGLNPYWQSVQRAGGLYQSNINNLSPQAFKNQLAQQYGVNPNQVQINAQGHAYIPFQYMQGYAQAHSAASPSQTGNTFGNIGAGALQGAGNVAGSGVMGAGNTLATQIGSATAPMTNGIPTVPTFQSFSPDYSGWQPVSPFNWDQNAAMQQAQTMYDPQYQQMINTEDSRINEQMNARGMFNSGIAQNAVDQQNQALYGKESDAINKYLTQNRSEAYKEWQGQANLAEKQNEFQITQQLNSYKANVQAMYDSGRLTQQQYVDAMNAADKAATQALNQSKADEAAYQAAGYTRLPDGSIVPTEQAQQNDVKNSQFDQTMQLKWYQFNNLSAQQQAQFHLDNQKLDLQQQQMVDTMQKAMLPYQYVTKYQQQEIALKQQEQSFNQWAKQQSLAQGAARIQNAQNNAGFNQWLQKAKLSLDWQKQTDSQKEKTINDYIKIQNAVRAQNEANASNITRLVNVISTSTDTATQANAQQQLTNLINQGNGNASNISYDAGMYLVTHPNTKLSLSDLMKIDQVKQQYSTNPTYKGYSFDQWVQFYQQNQTKIPSVNQTNYGGR